jgi:hypothetical protein
MNLIEWRDPSVCVGWPGTCEHYSLASLFYFPAGETGIKTQVSSLDSRLMPCLELLRDDLNEDSRHGFNRDRFGENAVRSFETRFSSFIKPHRTTWRPKQGMTEHLSRDGISGSSPTRKYTPVLEASGRFVIFSSCQRGTTMALPVQFVNSAVVTSVAIPSARNRLIVRP